MGTYSSTFLSCFKVSPLCQQYFVAYYTRQRGRPSIVRLREEVVADRTAICRPRLPPIGSDTVSKIAPDPERPDEITRKAALLGAVPLAVLLLSGGCE